MTHYESAIDQIAERLQGTDASLTTSIAGILAAAMQELIEAEPTGTIGAAASTAATAPRINGPRARCTTQVGAPAGRSPRPSPNAI